MLLTLAIGMVNGSIEIMLITGVQIPCNHFILPIL